MIDIRIGDMLVELASIPDCSVDSCVTDPPYHLTSIVKRFGAANAAPAKAKETGVYARASAGFMGQTWDGGDVAFRPETWVEVLRVLKPGGHLLAFGGTRTCHRLACAIEDAGFEIRDQIDWMYGSGFPKSHNLDGEWEGWGTALKPAHEPIVMARKPLIGTVAENVLAHGVGVLNIDGCRAAMDERPLIVSDRRKGANGTYGDGLGGSKAVGSTTLGRWPANVIHDGSDEVLAGFPQANSTRIGNGNERTKGKTGMFRAGDGEPDYRDSGSAARFFYCAKASKLDRDEGLESLPDQKAGMLSETSGQHITRRDEGFEVAPRKNNHPTVKPTDLMRYLCRMVTPPGGIILDPFTGSGSTGKAAMLEGFRFIGIELKPEYAAIARARIEAAIPEWLK